MKLSDWARRQGVHPKAALVEAGSGGDGDQAVALYARVSSHDQKAYLERQVGRLTEWATAQGLQVVQTVSEVGSGMNGSRPKLRRLLADASVRRIVVEHRDRVARLRVHRSGAAGGGSAAGGGGGLWRGL